VTVKLIDWIGEEYPDALIMGGYDDCIIGICNRFGQEPIVAYDYDKVIAKLEKDGMSREEAIEWFQFNQIGAWAGKTTPCFITTTPGQKEIS
jgi:hypothetical protein